MGADVAKRTKSGGAAVTMLVRLARRMGIERSYVDYTGAARGAEPAALMAALRSLGVEIDRPEQAAAALQAEERRDAARVCEPTVVAWHGRRAALAIRGGATARAPLARCVVRLEDGGEIAWEARARRADLATGPAWRVDVPGDLPSGAHRMTIDLGRAHATTVVLSAPRKCYRDKEGGRSLGAFMPLYAARSKRNWGVGDLTDLRELTGWTERSGGSFFGTLPLFATFLAAPFEPSPYAPVSRLFWNEVFLDLEAAPEFARSARARRMPGGTKFKAAVRAQRRRGLVDYAGVYELKRRVLDTLADQAFSDPQRRKALSAFNRAHPEAASYAAFRASVERAGASWRSWPARLRSGKLRTSDYDAGAYRRHLYAQLLLHEQLGAFSSHGSRGGLYLDLPVGVHAEGFDTWRYPGAFLQGLAVGAPPDALFTGGQNWGFLAPHPAGCRVDGHAYFRASLRALLSHCAALRIDHVMGLHRLYCLPHGMDGAHGVYMRQPAEELYASLCIESHRAEAEVVGENLGTVPPEVNRALDRHGVLRMSVAQFEFQPKGRRAVPEPVAQTLASLNTHDTPTFAAFWRGDDAAVREKLGLIDRAGAAGERRERARLRTGVGAELKRRRLVSSERAGAAAVLRGVLHVLAASPAKRVLVNLEDLWLERRPQNVPGTSHEMPNWRIKAAKTVEEITASRSMARLMRELAALRGAAGRARRTKGKRRS